MTMVGDVRILTSRRPSGIDDDGHRNIGLQTLKQLLRRG
jgi:hypothetical protein